MSGKGSPEIKPKKSPDSYTIGKRHEIELARKLYKMGFAVIRAPASGRRAESLPYPDLVAIKHRNVLVISVKYRSNLSTVYMAEHEYRKVMTFAERADGVPIVAVKVRGLGDWRVIPLRGGNVTRNASGKVTITVDMIKNAKKLDDWLRENKLIS